MTDSEPNLIDLEDRITNESPDIETMSLSTSTTVSIEDNWKGQSIAADYSNDVVDFNFLKDQILPSLDDEVVIDIGNHTWSIQNYKDLTETKHIGPVFEVGGVKWRLLLFPRNNNHNMALYLEPIPPTKKEEGTVEDVLIDPKWYVCAQFTLVLSNPKDPTNYILSTSHQRFSKDATDWGFSNFVDIRSLWNARKENGPLAYENKVNITAFVKVLKDTTGVLWHNFMDYDSKEVTGFVGFNNQGATCYLNSLLQSYFFTKIFRKAVYQIPTENEVPSDSVPLALQRIFYQLQKSEEALDTSELTKSFGWDTGDAFTQHDVQELNRVLMDKLETKLKSTSVENILNETFVGKMKSYIKCINVNYESSRIEDFWDIQLNVKNLSNLTESFQNYIEVEVMDGENQYAAQDFGLQDAKKGVVFQEFPNVLHLQLKRFEYDFNYDTLVKINDRYEYPESIDLSPFLDHSGSSEKPVPCIYDLHGVLVHAGDITTGHYYTMIKPDKSDNWYRFDDDKVWKVTKRQVFEENFGMDLIPNEKLAKISRAQFQAYQVRRHTSAYMLVYIKREAVDTVLQEVTDEDIPRHISQQVNRELEERAAARKEVEEQHLYVNLKFYTNSLFQRYEGFDLGADDNSKSKEGYTDEDFPVSIKALKSAHFVDLFPELNEKLGINCTNVEFWAMQYRRNTTCRPSSKIEEFESLTVEEVYDKYFFKKHSKGNIWVEQPELQLTKLSNCEIMSDRTVNIDEKGNFVEAPKLLIFVKYFDMDAQTLKGLTHVFVNEESLVLDIFPNLRKLLGCSDDQKLEIFEEINAGLIDKINESSSFYQSELSSGDIVTVQKKIDSSTIDVEKQAIYPFYRTVEDYYLYLRTRIYVTVKKIPEPSEDDGYVVNNEDDNELSHKEISFMISTQAKYEVLAKIIGKKFNVAAENLRIFVNYAGQRTQLRTEMVISNIIPRVSYSIQPLFEYELLSIPLKKLENMRLLKVNWLAHGYMRYQANDFFVEKSATLAEILDKLQSKFNFTDDERASVLFWGNTDSRFYQILFEETEVQTLSDAIDIYASVLPEESQILERYYLNQRDSDEPELTAPNPRLIPVLQFYKDPRVLHGISFVFPLYPGEKITATRDRLQKQLGLGQKDFSKVMLCSLDSDAGQPVYFESEANKDDSLELYVELSDSDYLGLDHPDRTTRQGGPHVGGISIR